MATAVKRTWPSPSPSLRSQSPSSHCWPAPAVPMHRQHSAADVYRAALGSASMRHSPSPGVEVCDQGNNALKVRAADAAPHLVSLGSGRLSTNITLIHLAEGNHHFSLWLVSEQTGFRIFFSEKPRYYSAPTPIHRLPFGLFRPLFTPLQTLEDMFY